MATVTRTFELSEEAANELDRLAESQQCGAAEVLNTFFAPTELRRDDFTAEQWADIEEGFADAKAGRFVSDTEVQAMLDTYRLRT